MRIPSELKVTLAQLSPDARDAFHRDYAGRAKSIGWAYVLWAVAGAHYAYVRERRTQLVFLLTLGGLGAWWLVDAVRIPRLVERVNEDIARGLLAQYRSLGIGGSHFGPTTSRRPEPTAVPDRVATTVGRADALGRGVEPTLPKR